jgi:hypothetical protein
MVALLALRFAIAMLQIACLSPRQCQLAQLDFSLCYIDVKSVIFLPVYWRFTY